MYYRQTDRRMRLCTGSTVGATVFMTECTTPITADTATAAIHTTADTADAVDMAAVADVSGRF